MKDIAFVKPSIYRFTLWSGNLNSRPLICKENYIHYPFDAHGAFCYARSFWLPIFCSVSFAWAHKSEPTSLSKFLFFCNEMGYASGTYPSHF